MRTPPSITSPYAPDLEKVRAWIEKMIKAMKFVELVTAVIALLGRMRDVNTELATELAAMKRKRPPSETLERLERQLVLPLFDAVVRVVATPPKHKTRTRKDKHPGRNKPPAHLERIPIKNEVPAEARVCPLCGTEMKTVSFACCETLDVIPARIVVVQRLDETVACPHDDTIVSAPVPPQIVERGKLGDTLIVEALSDKYLEHLPIERQCTRFARAGVDLAPPTLGRAVGAAIDLLRPLVLARTPNACSAQSVDPSQ